MDELEKIEILREIRDSVESIAVVFKLINFIIYFFLLAVVITFILIAIE